MACFHCGSEEVIWGGDFSFDDYGMDGDGIVHELFCNSCGARITYEVACDNGNDEEHTER